MIRSSQAFEGWRAESQHEHAAEQLFSADFIRSSITGSQPFKIPIFLGVCTYHN